MKKVLQTQKLTQSRYLVLLTSGYKKIFYMTPRVACWCLFRHWSTTNHVRNQPPRCDRSRCLSASNFICCATHYQPSYPPPLFSPSILSSQQVLQHPHPQLVVIAYPFTLSYPLSKHYSTHILILHLADIPQLILIPNPNTYFPPSYGPSSLLSIYPLLTRSTPPSLQVFKFNAKIKSSIIQKSQYLRLNFSCF